MIELRLNPVTGKHEVPGPNTHGRVYKVIDQMTGEVGYTARSATCRVSIHGTSR